MENWHGLVESDGLISVTITVTVDGPHEPIPLQVQPLPELVTDTENGNVPTIGAVNVPLAV